MSFIVREADIYADKNILLNILKENRDKDFPFEKRYDWLYYDNPFGTAIAWIIWDEKKAYPAGFTAVYPRKMLIKQQEILCWNCGDFSIEKKYRTLGVAVKLRKAAKNEVDSGKVPFLYAHPNNRMVHIHLRAGHQKIAQMKRYALPLRLSKYAGNPAAAKVVKTVIDPVVSFALKKKFYRSGSYENVSQTDMHFHSGFQELCETLNGSFPIVGFRNEAYLTWKYKNHPIYDYKLFNYYEKGKLTGYIFYYRQGDTLYITELISKLDNESPLKLLKTFINFVLNNFSEVATISTIVQEYNPYLPLMTEIGFRYRDDSTSDVIAYAAREELKPIVLEGKNWLMNNGDRDI